MGHCTSHMFTDGENKSKVASVGQTVALSCFYHRETTMLKNVNMLSIAVMNSVHICSCSNDHVYICIHRVNSKTNQ